MPGYAFSVTTGMSCTGGSTPTTPSSSGLSGGAGSIEDADFITSLNNEDVGEDEEDVEVAGLEIEADDGSDIELTAVTLDFDYADTGGSDDLDDYAAEVSVWFNGDEFARMNAREFKDNNNFARTISLDPGAIIRAGETGDLVVAVSGVSNLDSTDQGEKWNVQFTAVRFRDAQGASVTDNTTGDIDNTSNNDTTTNSYERQFTFESFASAANVDLKIAEDDDDVNEAHVIELNEDDSTDDVPLLSFTIEVEGNSDVLLDDLPVNLDSVTGGTGDLDSIVSSVSLVMDGDVVGTETVTDTSSDDDETVTFDNLDLLLEAGQTYEFLVTADINELDGTIIIAGDTISAQISSTERDAINAEDESGEDLATTDMSGTTIGDAHAIFETGISVTVSSITETASTNDGNLNDTATFQFKYTVRAFGGDVWVSDTADATIDTTLTLAEANGDDGVFYVVDQGGTATVSTGGSNISSTVVFTPKSGVSDTGANGIKINEDVTADFTLTVTYTNDSVDGVAGLFRAAMEAISWEDAAAGADEFLYNFNFDEVGRADYIFIN